MEHKEIFRGFADNVVLFDAVKKTLQARFSMELLDHTKSSIELGQEVKARLIGLQAVEEAFNEIAQYGSVPAEPERINKAY